MSRENVDLVRALFGAFNARDEEGLVSRVHLDAVFVPLRARVEGDSASYHGPDGFRRFLHDTAEDWAELQLTDLAYQDLEPRVLVTGRFRARSTSGIELDRPGAWIAECADGKLVRLQTFTDPAAAAQAAGVA